jgi:ferrous iron transport protein B
VRKALLVGNPNVGKSLLFSRITRTGAEVSNYAGTTVSARVGRFIYGGEEYELVDGPGLYSLEAATEAEAAALALVEGVDAAAGDVVVDVIDSTNLERNLGLTLELASRGLPMVVCANLSDEAGHKGVSIDVSALSRRLGLPVVAASALEGRGVSELLAALPSARPSGLAVPDGGRWAEIGSIVGEVQSLRHRHHSFLERLSDFTLHPVGGPASALAVLAATLLLVRFLGENLASAVFEPFYSRLYAPLIHDLAGRIPWPFAVDLLVGRGADPLASFGVLTSGIYIAIVLVFPYFFSFYLAFGLLEDFGYLPRLAVVLDKAFHRLGLHGYSSIPVMLGLGCKVPAFMSARMLSSQREKILTLALVFMSAPCLPQTSMIVALGMGYGVGAVLSVFGALIVVAVLTNLALNSVLKGERTELFTEIPSYRIPRPELVARKLGRRLAEYFVEVLPMIAVGVLALNLLEAAGAIGAATEAIRGPARAILGLPEQIAPILILGFLRKDASIALLAPLGLSAGQFVTASFFLALYAPCVASFFSLARELGVAGALKVSVIVFAAATAGGAAIRGIAALLGAA